MLEAMTASATFGDVLRDWRRRRRLSQLDLALEADVSARHVSFVENGSLDLHNMISKTLPLDDINGGLARSVARSVERLAARLLIGQVLAAGTADAVLGPAAEAQLIEQLVAYGPTAGAVFGIELARARRPARSSGGGGGGHGGGAV